MFINIYIYIYLLLVFKYYHMIIIKIIDLITDNNNFISIFYRKFKMIIDNNSNFIVIII